MLESKTLVLLPNRATTTDLDRFSDFDCGDEDYQRELVDFLLGHALGEGRSRYNTTYVFYDDLARPLAFVALACSSIDAWSEASANAGNVPVLLIEMLAVDRRNQHRGVGARSCAGCASSPITRVGCRFLALYCDERNAKARAFYRRQGFFEPPLRPRATASAHALRPRVALPPQRRAEGLCRLKPSSREGRRGSPRNEAEGLALSPVSNQPFITRSPQRLYIRPSMTTNGN